LETSTINGERQYVDLLELKMSWFYTEYSILTVPKCEHCPNARLNAQYIPAFTFFNVNKTTVSLKTLTRPLLAYLYALYTYIHHVFDKINKIWIRFRITHCFPSISLFFLRLTYVFTYMSMIYVHWLSVKYTKYYSSFAELRLYIYMSLSICAFESN